MIAWMQKHNKYLVITIWIATIAFIGAGFVGWGSYQYGKKAEYIARVGDIEISQDKFNLAYGNMYRKYAEIFKGNFDDAKAREMQLAQRVFKTLATQALLLNLAKEYGVIVSDEELATYIASMPLFSKDGKFDKKIYDSYVGNLGMKAKSFESILRDELVVEKILALFEVDSLPFEREVVSAALSLSDKIKYSYLNQNTLTVELDEKELEKYWSEHKSDYMTPVEYNLSVVWTDTTGIEADEEALKSFYEKNVFNYVENDGRQSSFEEARKSVEADYRLKKGKKQALLDYIAFKKGKKEASANLSVADGDPVFTQTIWKNIKNGEKGAFLKPEAVGQKYVTIKIESIDEPREMSFEEAKTRVEKDAKKWKLSKLLDEKSKELLEDTSALSSTSGFLSVSGGETLAGLTPAENSEFVRKLFISNNKKGIIRLSNGVIVYEIIEQKIGKSDAKLQDGIAKVSNEIKKNEFEREILKDLAGRYSVKKYVKGI
jgi:peptidyl-prolyl cis-trans isomerase D